MSEPRGLHELLAWFREAWSAEMPARCHERGIEPFDALGSPRWHAAFRSYILGSDWAVDEEGSVRRPVRAHYHALARSSGRGGKQARYLFVLACSDFDPLLAWRRVAPLSDGIGEYADDVGLGYAEHTIRLFWRRCQSEPRRYLRPREGAMARVGKSEAQHHAEEAGGLAQEAYAVGN